MEKLIKELDEFKKQLPKEEQVKLSDELLSKLYSVYPFNKFEYVISHLIANKVIDLKEYLRIRSEYLTRNKYLHLFEIAPRTFGETWGQQHLTELVPEFQHPSPLLDSDYEGQYDLWLEGIRVEVKASRAVKRVSGATLTEKALSSGSKAKFDMNFQQINLLVAMSLCGLPFGETRLIIGCLQVKRLKKTSITPMGNIAVMLVKDNYG